MIEITSTAPRKGMGIYEDWRRNGLLVKNKLGAHI
jgi:hypothetical protein